VFCTEAADTSEVTLLSEHPADTPPDPHPETFAGGPGPVANALLWGMLIGPFLALAVGVVLAVRYGVGPSPLDVVLLVVLYAVSGHGVTVGYHRYFTHSSFAAPRWLRITLAVSGSLAVEGPVNEWVATHRRHHAHADEPGDPHSPWQFGTRSKDLVRGLWWAHMGWFWSKDETNRERFVPDLLADPDMVRVSRAFPLLAAASIVGPAVLGGVLTLSWTGALTAGIWAGLVRMALLHHVTWATNSICHVFGDRPFVQRGKATNFWPLAILSMGESWHNLHHADPTSARHGVDKGQLDTSARVIRLLEQAGWVSKVKWPDRARLDRKRVALAA